MNWLNFANNSGEMTLTDSIDGVRPVSDLLTFTTPISFVFPTEGLRLCIFVDFVASLLLLRSNLTSVLLRDLNIANGDLVQNRSTVRLRRYCGSSSGNELRRTHNTLPNRNQARFYSSRQKINHQPDQLRAELRILHCQFSGLASIR